MESSKRYGGVYTRINTQTIERSKQLFPTIWHVEPAVATEMMNAWAADVAKIYEIPAPNVEIVDAFMCSGHGMCTSRSLLLPKASVVTLFHEFKHWLDMKKQPGENSEDRARGWSMSLFKAARPKAYERACRRRLVLFNRIKEIADFGEDGEL